MRMTAAMLMPWLVTICIGLECAQAESPTATSTGRKGTAVNSSLTNPLTRSDREDGIFPAAAEAALKGPGGVIPSVALIGDASLENPVQVNGFPLNSLGQLLVEDGEPFEADYHRIAPIHPYFLNPGKNRIRVTGGAGAVAIANWDYVHGTEHNELLRITLPTQEEQTFSWPAQVPQRPWAIASQIEKNEASKQGLFASTASLQARMQTLWVSAANDEPTADAAAALKKELLESTRAFVDASELRGKPYRLIDQILEATTVRARPGDPAGSLELKAFPSAEELELEVFGGGTLARLRNATNGPLFTFVSNLPDGPRGRKGTAVLAFDAWYRQNDQSEWELDALFPRKAPGTWTQFELGPHEVKDLFRLSNF